MLISLFEDNFTVLIFFSETIENGTKVIKNQPLIYKARSKI